MAVRRLDYASFDASKFARSPSGGLVVPARLTRTGVFEYKTPNGETVREYRPESEVFSQASLATLNDAPVTVKHPSGEVTPDNWSTVSKGHVVAGSAAKSDEYLDAKLVLADAHTIDLALCKELVEISCGYTCDLVEEPGTSPAGEPYDRVQTNIVYNHVALGGTNWGRAGKNCAIKLDSLGHTCFNADYNPSFERLRMKHSVTRKGKVLRVDGVAFNLATPGERVNGKKAVDNVLESLRLDVANIRKDDATEAMALLKQVMEMLSEMAEPMTDAEEPASDKEVPAKDAESAPSDKEVPAKDADEEMEKRADERLSIVEKARALFSKVETKGKKNGEIMRAALAHNGVRLDGSEERIRGAFDAFPVPTQHQSLHDARGPVATPDVREDSNGETFEETHHTVAATAWRKGQGKK